MIETVRGRLDAASAAEVTAFWVDAGVLTVEEAQARLPEVVCIARDDEGAIIDTATASAEPVPFLGGQLFWLYRGLGSDATPALVAATYRALAAADEGPIGLVRAIADRAEIEARPQVVWEDPPFLYAGYLEDGRQIRVAYFDGARIRV